MKNLTTAIITIAAAISVCACGKEPTLDTKHEGTPTTSALPPKYLAIDQFKACLVSHDVGTYQSWCMPKTKPEGCPADSWNQLQSLQGSDKLPDCPSS